MDFGTQIKTLRQEQRLTQEQFAQRLSVTRQAVSNWENNKNLPDIGMLLAISEAFQVSLDYLIKGDNTMNNITEKIIRDGSETRRARFNTINTVLGLVLLLMGVLCFFIRANSVEYIDAEGFLHESFYLVPIGFLFLLCGLLVFLTLGLRQIIHHFKHR